MRRFRKSSAKVAYLKPIRKEDVPSVTMFRQFIIDNFDCAVTHALAMITIGPPGNREVDYDDMIPQIKKGEMSKPVCGGDEDNMALVQYTGQKNPSPPQIPAPDLPPEVLARQDACFKLAHDLDFDLLSNVISKEGVAESNGYMPGKCRERCFIVHPRSVV